jgi:ribulose-phosphate 3-epimerase
MLGQPILLSLKMAASYLSHLHNRFLEPAPLNTIYEFPAILLSPVSSSTSSLLTSWMSIPRQEAKQIFENLAQAGADVIIVHQEVCPHLHRVIQQIKTAGKMAAVALTPSTPVFMLEDILSLLDMVLIMTVNPGFGGQEFIPETLPKIARLLQMITQCNLHCDIEVDGGIHEATAPLVVQAGANLLVAGSAVYNEHESVAQAMARLRSAI